MVPEGDGLRPLQVRVPRHRRRGVGLCLVEERELEPQDLLLDRGDALPEPQALVERDLVVPAAGRVDLRAERAEDLREADLHVRVDVLEVLPPRERARLDLPPDPAQPLRERGPLLRSEDPGLGEHLGVRDAPRYVVAGELPVHGQGGEEPPRGRLHVRRGSACPALRVHGDRHPHFDLFEAFTRRGEAAFSPTAAHVRAGSPQMYMKPSAISWRNRSPFEYVASAWSYKEFGDARPTTVAEPLNSSPLTPPVPRPGVDSTNASRRRGGS